jgi:chloramphenicol-sensitive protein RarD
MFLVGIRFHGLDFWLGLPFQLMELQEKQCPHQQFQGLYIETLILLPFFLVFSIWFYSNFDIAFLNVDISTDILLFLAGAVTVVPLALFNAGAKLLPMTTVGILFLITPTLQFLVGYYLQNEAVNSNQLIGFVGVWTGLIMYSYGLIKDK